MMTPASFINWLSDMKSAGLAKTDLDCARLLGVTKNTILNLKERGGNHRDALACRALLHRMEPYK